MIHTSLIHHKKFDTVATKNWQKCSILHNFFFTTELNASNLHGSDTITKNGASVKLLQTIINNNSIRSINNHQQQALEKLSVNVDLSIIANLWIKNVDYPQEGEQILI